MKETGGRERVGMKGTYKIQGWEKSIQRREAGVGVTRVVGDDGRNV